MNSYCVSDNVVSGSLELEYFKQKFPGTLTVVSFDCYNDQQPSNVFYSKTM